MISIRTFLVSALLASFTLVTFLAALNGYRSSIAEAEILLDQQLADSSMLITLSPFPATGLSDGGASYKRAYQIWVGGNLVNHSPNADTEAIAPFAEGFHHINFGGYRWRCISRKGVGGIWIMLAERTDVRQSQVEKILLKAIMPLIWWLPVSGILVWILVTRGLRPIRSLVEQIDSKDSHDFEPLHAREPTIELSRLVDSTNALLARLGGAFEREKHFADNAAHELRTPLSVLKVHLHNLRKELPEKHEGLAYVSDGVDRMQHLIEQILDLNRTNPDTYKAQFHVVNLHSMAQRVTAASYPDFLNRQQNLELTGEASWVRGDELMLETLLQNILDNANKYTPTGGTITVSVDSRGDQVCLTVKDSGPGIPENKKLRVFERFYRLGGDRHDSGTIGCGLGLAIVEHIAKLHGASIQLNNSNHQGGLSFQVSFLAASEVTT